MGHKKDRGHHVCPWYLAYLFDNPLRSLFHNPERILGQYVKTGMKVLDIGCGMGFFSLGMAKMVGSEGRVISLDLQARMLSVLEKRARKKGLSKQIDSRFVGEKSFPVGSPVDFVLCCWMVHEVPNQPFFLREIYRVLKPGAHALIAEPVVHVKLKDLEKTVRIASEGGFSVTDRPRIRMSHAVVLEKTESNV